MKSSTIMNRINAAQECSIATAELLTNALHREGKLDEEKAVRFRPIIGDFDIVNKSLFTTGKFEKELCESVGSIDDLQKKFA